MATTKINGRQIDVGKAPITGSNSTLFSDAVAAGLTLTGSVFLLAAPTENLQAATKAYVDSVAGGGVTVNQIAYGNSDSSGVSSDGGLVYYPTDDILGVSGSIEFGGVTGNSIHGDASTGLNLSGTLVNVTSAAAMVVASTTFDVNASDDLTIDSSGGTISIGADDIDQAINIGTSGEREVTVGNTDGAAGLTLVAGTGGIDVDADNAIALDTTAGGVSIDAAGGNVNLTAATGSFTVAGTSVASNMTLTCDGATQDLTIALAGAFDSSLLMTSAGTGADAVSIDATAGSMLIAPNLANEKTLTIGPASATQMVFTPHGTAASEKISLTNTAGTAVDAIAVAASAGGLSLTAKNAASKFTVEGAALTLSGSGINIDGENAEVDITTAGNVDVNGAAITVDATSTLSLQGAGATDLQTSSGALTLAGESLDIDASAGAFNIAATSASTVTTSGGALTLDGQTGVDIQENGTSIISVSDSRAVAVANATTVAVDGSAAITIESSGGAISIGADDVDQNINIGTQGERTVSLSTGAFASTLAMGNATGATAVTLDAGTGGIALASTGDITLAGTVTIGITGSQQVGILAGAGGLTGSSASGMLLTSADAMSLQATDTFAAIGSAGVSLYAVDGGVSLQAGTEDAVTVILGGTGGAEIFSVIDSAAQTQFSVGSAGSVSFGDGAWDYSSTSIIAEPAFYFTSSVLLHNIANAAAVPTSGQAASYSGSLGASGEFFNVSPAVYLNGLRIRSGTTAQVTAGTRDYYSLKVTEDSVNYLVVSMSAPLVTGDVLQADFRRSS